MVATLKSISSSKNAGKYFYFTERHFENSSSFHDSKGAKELGISTISRKVLEDLLDGKITNEVNLGRITKAGLVHHPGQELILSAPKSVSIMGLVAGDVRILASHEAAVGRTLDYVEKHLIYTRIQENGVLRYEKTDSAIFAKFTHLTSRSSKAAIEPDPQIHTHVLIANATKCQDNKYRSIDFRALYEYKMLIGQIYRLELVRDLKDIGYEVNLIWDIRNRFTFEILGVPDTDILTFSKRRLEILLEAKRLEVEDAKSLAYIAKVTRQDKGQFSLEKLEAQWRERVNEIAELESLKEASKAGMRPEQKKVDSDKILNYSIKHLSEREAVWTRNELHAVMITKAGASFSIKDIEVITDEAISGGALLTSHDKNQNTLTTLQNLKAEEDVVELMQDLHGKSFSLMATKDINLWLQKNALLSQGQMDAISLIFTTKDCVIGVQGSAGSGKTTMLKIAKDMAETIGFELLGSAPTKSAAMTLQASANIKSQTLSAFLAKHSWMTSLKRSTTRLEKAKAEFQNKIVILDESSLASTTQVRDLLKAANRLAFRLVMLGDVNQLAAISAGRPFYYLQEHGMNVCVIGTIQRQQNEQLLQSVYLARDAVDRPEKMAASLIYKALQTLGRENIIDVSEAEPLISNAAVTSKVYEIWKSHFEKNIDLLVIVPSNSLRREINKMLRVHYVRGQEILHPILIRKDLTKAAMTDVKSYNINDVLLFNKKNSDFDINKGDYFIVRHASEVSPDAITLELFRERDHRSLQYNITHNSQQLHFAVFEEGKMAIAPGEKIKWTKNSSTNSFVVNGHSALVKSIEANSMILEAGNQLQVMNLQNQDLKHIDYDYSSTVYGAQGKTTQHVLGVDSKELLSSLITQRSFYTLLSRPRQTAILVTHSYEGLVQKIARSTGRKTSAIEHQLQKQSLADKQANLKAARRLVYTDKKEVQSEVATIRSSSGMKFFKNAATMRRIATEAFGSINARLSNSEHLRFGSKGKISVNLATGQWYDFSSAQGGSLYVLAKDKRILIDKNEVEISKVSKPWQKSVKVDLNKLWRNSVPLCGKDNIAARYLEDHRRINLKNLKLSTDVRFTNKAWSSETNSYHSALLAIARNEYGGITAVQTTYLDATANKNPNLTIQKRSQGNLRGSFVELSNNLEAKIIFIAEGMETALSILSAQSSCRVLCSLGISNIQNINLGDKNKSIVICADNDYHTTSKSVIDNVATELTKQGFKRVSIIRPELPGQDFNDVLKSKGIDGINEYIRPILEQHPCYKDKFLALESKIEFCKQNIELLDKKTLAHDLYKSPAKAQKLLSHSIKSFGFRDTLEKIKETPSMLGSLKGYSFMSFASKGRASAIFSLEEALKNFRALSLNSKLQKLHEQNHAFLKSNFIDKHLSGIMTLPTAIDPEQLKTDVERVVMRTLAVTDNKADFHSVNEVSEKIMQQVAQFKNWFGKEPGMEDKKGFFLRARYELSREEDLRGMLTKEIKPQSAGDIVLLNQKLERVIAIDSAKSNKNGLYYLAPNYKEVLLALNEGDRKIHTLTREFMNRNMDLPKASFIATEIVKYQERYSVNMPFKQQESLNPIGDYVSKTYHEFIAAGFSKGEATCAYREGACLALKYDKSSGTLVSEMQLKQIQQESTKSMQPNAMINKASVKQKELEIEM